MFWYVGMSCASILYYHSMHCVPLISSDNTDRITVTVDSRVVYDHCRNGQAAG